MRRLEHIQKLEPKARKREAGNLFEFIRDYEKIKDSTPSAIFELNLAIISMAYVEIVYEDLDLENRKNWRDYINKALEQTEYLLDQDRKSKRENKRRYGPTTESHLDRARQR